MAVNVQGPIFITQAFLPHIPKHAGGRIIMLSSVSARAGPVGDQTNKKTVFCVKGARLMKVLATPRSQPHQSVYACSKISVEQLCNVWTHEFGQSVCLA